MCQVIQVGGCITGKYKIHDIWGYIYDIYVVI